jgi:hypothetical protein
MAFLKRGGPVKSKFHSYKPMLIIAGGPLPQVIAGKLVTFKEVLASEHGV